MKKKTTQNWVQFQQNLRTKTNQNERMDDEKDNIKTKPIQKYIYIFSQTITKRTLLDAMVSNNTITGLHDIKTNKKI